MPTSDVPGPAKNDSSQSVIEPPIVGGSANAVGSSLVQRWPETSCVFADSASLLIALAGLSALLFCLAGLLAIAMFLLNELNVPTSPFVLVLFIIQTLLLPPLSSFSFTVTTGMFWFGGILTRFALVLMAVAPAYAVFCWLLYALDEGPDSVFGDVFVVLFACLMGAAAIAVLVQMWTPWSLVHDIDLDKPPPTGIRALAELTVLVAVGLAVMSVWDLKAYFEGLVLIGGISVLATVATIGAQVGYLGETKWRWLAFALALMGSLGTSLFLNGFAVFEEYGRAAGAFISFAGIWLGLSLYGWLIVLAMTWVQLRWLKFCGWRCLVKRRGAAAAIPDTELDETNAAVLPGTPHPLD